MKKVLLSACMVLLLAMTLSTVTWSIELKADDIEVLKQHEGEFVTVIGEVLSTHIARSGKVRFLNLGANWRTAFKCVIFTGDLKDFDTIGEPTEYYSNKKVTVTGIIKIYEGLPEIIVKNPSQIVIQK